MTHAAPRLHARRVVASFATLSTILGFWMMRSETRAQLRELDREGLADIGLTEAARRRECARWFWQ